MGKRTNYSYEKYQRENRKKKKKAEKAERKRLKKVENTGEPAADEQAPDESTTESNEIEEPQPPA